MRKTLRSGFLRKVGIAAAALVVTAPALAIMVPAVASASPGGRLPVFAVPQGQTGPSEADRKEAKKWFDEGAAFFSQGAYEDAIEAWEKSFELSQEPLIFDSISNAYERLGNLEKAVEYLKLWRDEATAKELPILDKRIQNLEKRIADKPKSEPDGPPDDPKDEPEPKTPSGPSPPIAGIVLTAVGGAAVVGGIIVGAIGAGQRPEESEVCSSGTGKSLCLSNNQDDIESSSTLAGVGDLLWIGGAVTAAVGIVLIITHDPGPASFGGVLQPSATLEVGPHGAFLRGTF